MLDIYIYILISMNTLTIDLYVFYIFKYFVIALYVQHIKFINSILS